MTLAPNSFGPLRGEYRPASRSIEYSALLNPRHCQAVRAGGAARRAGAGETEGFHRGVASAARRAGQGGGTPPRTGGLFAPLRGADEWVSAQREGCKPWGMPGWERRRRGRSEAEEPAGAKPPRGGVFVEPQTVVFARTRFLY